MHKNVPIKCMHIAQCTLKKKHQETVKKKLDTNNDFKIDSRFLFVFVQNKNWR